MAADLYIPRQVPACHPYFPQASRSSVCPRTRPELSGARTVRRRWRCEGGGDMRRDRCFPLSSLDACGADLTWWQVQGLFSLPGCGCMETRRRQEHCHTLIEVCRRLAVAHCPPRTHARRRASACLFRTAQARDGSRRALDLATPHDHNTDRHGGTGSVCIYQCRACRLHANCEGVGCDGRAGKETRCRRRVRASDDRRADGGEARQTGTACRRHVLPR